MVPKRNPFKMYSPENIIRPLESPPRPDVFDEVQLGPFVTEKDAKLAYRVWSLPDSSLGEEWKTDLTRPYQRPNTQKEKMDMDMHVLAHNVYEHLMISPLMPTPQPVSDSDGEQEQTWDTATIFVELKDEVIVQSHAVSTSPYWKSETLKAELKRRGLPVYGVKTVLAERLVNDELEKSCSFLPRSDLSRWAINRPERYTLKPAHSRAMSALDMYTWAVQLSPYNPTYWTSRAYCHYQKGFFDLAIGDAYRAQLLCEVVTRSKERTRRPGLYPRIWHAIEQHLLVEPRKDGAIKPEIDRFRGQNGINCFIPTLQKALNNIISLSLLGLNSWDEYDTHHHETGTRLDMSHRDKTVPENRKRVAEPVARACQREKKRQKLFFHEKRQGWTPSGCEYPYETTDVDRYEPKFLQTLNRNLFPSPNGSRAPKWPCEVRPSTLGQGLGIFATTDIKTGEPIFCEEPTIRGHLHARRMEDDTTAHAGDQADLNEADQQRCENCQRLVDQNLSWRYQRNQRNRDAIHRGTDPNACKCLLVETRGPDKGGLIFCPPSRPGEKSCLQIARKLYHFGSCGKDWTWLHDAMRPIIFRTWEPSEHISHLNECHGTLLSLLLRHVFEITLHRREDGSRNLMAHEIDELLALDGHYSGNWPWNKSRFPFTLAANIQVPFDILTHLGVDIFRDLSFDTWVIQIVLRKLLTNAVPWEIQRRGRVPEMWPEDRQKRLEDPGAQKDRLQAGLPITRLDPSFMNLYLFPGLSMFNHCCRQRQNAEWAFDDEVPNRVIVWAKQDISKGQEIHLRYQYGQIKAETRATRLFGRSCQCAMCKLFPRGVHTPPYDGDDDSDGSEGTLWSEVDDEDDDDNEFDNVESGAANGTTNTGQGKAKEKKGKDKQKETSAGKREWAEVEDNKVIIHCPLQGEPALALEAGLKRRKVEDFSFIDPDQKRRLICKN